MSLWKKIFGGGQQGTSSNSQEQARGKSGEVEEIGEKLPGAMLQPEFGEVRVGVKGNTCHVQFTILMEPDVDLEGWQTGVALDASGSMMGAFGQALDTGPKGEPPQALIQEHIRKGSLKQERQGTKVRLVPTPACQADFIEKGYWKWSKNVVQEQATKFTSYLASNLDADGGTTVIYWACGDGSQIEVIGDFTAEQCQSASFKGPTKNNFGQRTVLMPAVMYFADRFKDAKNGMYIFVTDGALHDLEHVKSYTISLCKDIQAKRRNPLKCVLIGLGDSINESQMEQLDELDSGTDVDIWDHKIAADMHNILEIFTELVSKNRIVTKMARILDSAGNVVANVTDGLPAEFKFSMPANSTHFVLEVAGKQIKQSVQMPAK